MEHNINKIAKISILSRNKKWWIYEHLAGNYGILVLFIYLNIIPYYIVTILSKNLFLF